ncbi:MAG: hypothetical protein JNM56_24905 [Planctomycetia bacterium]|nr:hypothetical protein [Planctomycetia bacterium]
MKRLLSGTLCRYLGSRLRLALVLALVLTTLVAPVKLPAEFWQIISSESHEETRTESKGEDPEAVVRTTTKTSRRVRKADCVVHLAHLSESERLPLIAPIHAPAAPPTTPHHLPNLSANLRC